MLYEVITREKVPEYLCEIYDTPLTFSKNYIIPKPFDKRLIVEISAAVAEAAIRITSYNVCYTKLLRTHYYWRYFY